MKNIVLTVLLGIAVILVGVGGVAAHGTDADSDRDIRPETELAADWAAWIEGQMTKQMGADRAAEMQERMDMSYEEMGEHMASHQNGSMSDGEMSDGEMRGGGMSGMECH